MKTCGMGISSSSNQIVITFVQIVLYNSLTYYGAQTVYGTDIPLAACGIVMKTNAIVLAIVVGISQGVQPIIGFNHGAKQYTCVRKAYLLAGPVADFSAFLLSIVMVGIELRKQQNTTQINSI